MIEEQEIDVPEIEIEQDIEEPASLREQIENSLNEIKERDASPEEKEKPLTEVKVEKPRAKDGKFAEGKSVKTEVLVEPDIPAPQSYSKAVEQAWNTLPKELKLEINKREQEFHRQLTNQDNERLTGKKFQEVILPYVAQMRAEGAEPLQAVQTLLNTAHILRVGTPAQKAKLLIDTARQFGVDISQAQQNQPRVDPVIAQLAQKQAYIEQQLQNQQRQVIQQKEAQLVNLVNTFASDTANYPHFSQVEAEMMALLQGGIFKDVEPAERLKKVYDYAVHANPQTRSTLIQNATQHSLEQRVADKKAKADAARKAGSSIRGKPGMLANQEQTASGSLRDQLRAQMREAREA